MKITIEMKIAIYTDGIKIWLKGNTSLNLLAIEKIVVNRKQLIEYMYLNGITDEQAAGVLSMIDY